MGRDFLSDALHHEHDTALAGGVIHMASPWNHLMNAAHANNLPSGAGNFLADAAAFELADCFSRAEKLPGEIHVQHKLPVRQAHLVNWRILLQARVVNQDVDGTELLDHFFEHG